MSPTEAPSETGGRPGDRAFLQRRLGLFGWLGGVCSLCFTLAFAASFALDPDRGLGTWLETSNSWLDLLGTVAFFLLWVICRWPSIPRRGLQALDVIAFLMIGITTSGSQIVADLSIHPVSTTLLCTTLMIFRAVIVPSTRRRTFLVAVLTVPLAGMALAVPARHPGVHFEDPELRLGLMVWVLVGAIVSVAISSTLYGLRRAVREAQRLGQYHLEERIGQGGMGSVYRARHAMLRRPTAVKIIRPEVVSEETIQRFEREVQITAGLQHPNTIAIYDFGRSVDGIFFYAMEYLEGLTFEQLIRRDGPQPAARVAALLRQVCGSLAEAHSRGLVHRDIKPANLFLTRRGGVSDVVKVMDFGLVQEATRTREDQGDLIMGTPAYMAPELIAAPEAVGPASDLYALGAVGWFLLTGRQVFDAASVGEMLAHHRHTTPIAPSEAHPATANTTLDALIAQCLAKLPEDRPASAELFAVSLAGVAEDWEEQDALRWWDAFQAAPSSEPTPEWHALDEAPSTLVLDRRLPD